MTRSAKVSGTRLSNGRNALSSGIGPAEYSGGPAQVQAQPLPNILISTIHLALNHLPIYTYSYICV